MALLAVVPHSSPVSTTIRAVNGSRAEAALAHSDHSQTAENRSL